MRAVEVSRFGGPDVLRLTEVDRPSPISTEVLVRVAAAGVNPVDLKTRRGDDTMLLLDTLREGGLLLAVADGASEAVQREGRRRRVRVMEPLVEPDGHALEKIAGLVDSGDLEVKIDEVFPLERAAAAHERLEKGSVRGKLVLEVEVSRR